MTSDLDAGALDGAPARDRRTLYATAFLRALATGLVGILLGLYLARRGLAPSTIGLVVAAGLAGAAFATFIVTVASGRVARRPLLVALAALTAVGGAGMVFAPTASLLAAIAFVGMVNGMGRDRGAALVLEQAVLPATVPDARRTLAFAWYTVLQDAGHALGSLLAATAAPLAALVATYHARRGTDAGSVDVTALHMLFGVYVILALATAVLYLGLSPAVELARTERTIRLTPESRRVVTKLSALFAIDSLGGGFLTTALLTVFFTERFGVGAAGIGALFFVARIANAGSHLAAAWLAEKIGLVNTMVFTHLPSSLLLVTMAFAPTFPVAAAFFILREGLVEMDVPTRQSYVMAVVRPAERTVAAGVTNLVRLGGWAVAPAFAGMLMQGGSLATPLIAGAAMKIAYDVLLYRAFVGLRPPEESAV